MRSTYSVSGKLLADLRKRNRVDRHLQQALDEGYVLCGASFEDVQDLLSHKSGRIITHYSCLI